MMGYVVENQYGVVTVNDEATKDKPKEIRFITPHYDELFRIPDGGHVLVKFKDGEIKDYGCKYLDSCHLLIGRNAYHICELAERMEAIGAHIEPFPEKRIIWSNRNLDPKDWKDDYLAWEEKNEYDYDEDELFRWMEDTNNSYFDDEKSNLNCDAGENIIAIADIGRWNGRVTGYKELNSNTLSACLDVMRDCEYNEWFVDRDGEFRSTQSHHDGTNYVYYRAWKPEATEKQREELLGKIYDGEATQKDIDDLTEKLGQKVGKVYGWSFPTETKDKTREER